MHTPIQPNRKPVKPRVLHTALTVIGITVISMFRVNGMSQQTVTGQTARAENARFDVASIRQGKSGESPNYSITRSEFIVTNVTLEELIQFAYYPQLRWYWPRERGVLGAPRWSEKEVYTVDAKVDGATAERWKSLTYLQLSNALKPAIQAMLEERCKLALHTTMESRPIWALQVGKHGPKLKKADSRSPLSTQGAVIAEGGRMMSGGRGNTSTITFFSAPMTSLAEVLTRSSSRLVIDQTKLSGTYNFLLLRNDMGNAESLASDPNPSSKWDLEALGLTLKSEKAPTKILVIDHIDRPSSN
jgi:uncharacterized protein (TIGR03435 family)